MIKASFWTGMAASMLLLGCTPSAGDAFPSDDAQRMKLSKETTPIIFTHGLGGFRFHKNLQPYLESLGYSVYFTTVDAYGSIESRSKQLEEQTDAFLDSMGADRGIIVGHSMGGLDARWLVSDVGRAYDRIDAVVSIDTPHRGSPMADYVMYDVPFFLRSRVDRFLKDLDLAPEDAEESEAIRDLTAASTTAFNETVYDNPNVEYYSYSSEQTLTQGLNPLLYVSYYVIKGEEGANDGLVAPDSAKWGHFLGHFDNADHLDVIGGFGLETHFDYKGLAVEAIELTFQHNNQGTYNPTWSTEAPVTSDLPESEHSYWNNLDDTQSYTLPNAASLMVTFDEYTELEHGYDYLYVTDEWGDPVEDSPYTGAELAGTTLWIPGDTVNVRLSADYSVTSWGYAVTDVEEF